MDEKSTDSEPKRYLIIVQMDKASTIERLGKDVPNIIAVFQRVSRGELELAFRSSDGTLFGYFVKSSTKPVFLKVEFEKSQATTNKDTTLIVELGDQVDGSGFSRAWTWLQHH